MLDPVTTAKTILSLKPLIETGLKKIQKVLAETKSNYEIKSTSIEEHLNLHIQGYNNWADEIAFKDLKEAKSLQRIYIELDLFLTPRRLHHSPSERENKISFENIFKNSYKHLIILGQPGAGKTTCMKKLWNQVVLEENFFPELFAVPIVIRLRDLTKYDSKTKKNRTSGLFERLQDILGIIIKFEDNVEVDKSLVIQKVIILLLEELKALLVLDGFDEISDEQSKNSLLEEFKILTLNCNNARIILTSRTSDFHYSIDNTSVFEICALDQKQIRQFATKWLEEEYRYNDFIQQIEASPLYDTTIRPLTLSHLCAIYERSGSIPVKPKTVYRKIINLLLEEWNEQNSVRRTSKYSNFEPDRKFEFLSNLAFELTTTAKTTFSSQLLNEVYKKIHFNYGLPLNEAKKVMQEIETHNGLILLASYDSYEFAHKSMQEYLTAEFMVRLPNIPHDHEFLFTIPGELAIATAISSDPSYYLYTLLFEKFNLNNKTQMLRLKQSEIAQLNMRYESFFENYLNRLIVEKVDFVTSVNLGISFLHMYTILVYSISSSGQMKLFHPNNVHMLETLIATPVIAKSIEAVKKYYTEDPTHPYAHDKNIIVLKKKGKVQFRHMALRKYIPDHLIPEILFAKRKYLTANSTMVEENTNN